MIIFKIFDRRKNTIFTKVFDSPYNAEKFRNRINHSKRFSLVHAIYDFI